MSEQSEKFDLLVIGGGPGGYVCALRGAQLGLKTALVEREHLGGICLNWGCIPTKALLRSAEVYHEIQKARDYGIVVSEVTADLSAMVQRSRTVSGRLNAGVSGLLKKNKVSVIWGEARITKPYHVTVSQPLKAAMQPQHPVPRGILGYGTYEAEHIVVATGARPRILPGLEPDGHLIWTYFEAMAPERLPKSLIVVGSGAIGVEFASFYQTLGCQVTIVEILPQILPAEDHEISALARKMFEARGMKILSNTTILSVEKGEDHITLEVSTSHGTPQKLTAERLISAVGVVGNTDGLGLRALGISGERGGIKTDAYGRTDVPGVYAIGDVAGPPLLAHKAEHEGVICAEAIAGLNPSPLNKEKIPGCTYCSPQIASIGLTEQKAKDLGQNVRIGRFPYAGNGKAIALGHDQGMIKTIFSEETGELLGAHLIGAEVTELISTFVTALHLETTEEDLMHTIFPHPTLSEMIGESVLDAYGRALHK